MEWEKKRWKKLGRKKEKQNNRSWNKATWAKANPPDVDIGPFCKTTNYIQSFLHEKPRFLYIFDIYGRAKVRGSLCFKLIKRHPIPSHQCINHQPIMCINLQHLAQLGLEIAGRVRITKDRGCKFNAKWKVKPGDKEEEEEEKKRGKKVTRWSGRRK